MDKSLMPKTKHDHKWTEKLKVIIFALLMLAPLFSVLVKCLYTLNPNAKDSYYGEEINEKQLNQVDYQYLKTGQTYRFINENRIDVPLQAQTTMAVENFVIYSQYNTNGNPTYPITEVNRILFWKNSNNVLAFEMSKINESGYYSTFTTIAVDFEFTFMSFSNQDSPILEYANWFYQTIYNKNSYLDNSFYYAVNQIKEEQTFSWVKNTIVYNGINAMNVGFGLDSNHVLTYLISYWTILTAIYIVIDIILFLFTKLTHLLQ